ncbi:MAG: hypothetical protein ACK5IN_05005 [Microbacterium sp.]|uniref:hypothetical protein n=1 Tax=Microbacterium sp. TaxID=51671 RepID=UPI003A8A8F40
MVTLLLDSTRLEVALSFTERKMSFRRKNVFIERSAIAKVQLTGDAWNWLRGVASPGTYLPGLIAMGTWTSASGSDFAVIRRRRPAVVIDLEGDAEFQRIVLTTTHGLALITALHLDDVDEAADVAQLAGADAAQPAPASTPRTRPAAKPAQA